MVSLVPQSNGEALVEFNSCHRGPGPGGGQFCSGNEHGVSRAYLSQDVRRTNYPVKISKRVFSSAGMGRIHVADEGPRKAMLSTLRHEIGHTNLSKRDNHRVYGHADYVLRGEVSAWKNAIRASRTGRVDWALVDRSLKGYAEMAHGWDSAAAAPVHARNMRVLRRYARRLRITRRRAA